MSPEERGRARRWALVEEGYCIRCRAAIPGDPERPLCRACEGAEGEEEEEGSGAYCLACGAGAATTAAEPVCAACRARLYA